MRRVYDPILAKISDIPELTFANFFIYTQLKWKDSASQLYYIALWTKYPAYWKMNEMWRKKASNKPWNMLVIATAARGGFWRKKSSVSTDERTHGLTESNWQNERKKASIFFPRFFY